MDWKKFICIWMDDHFNKVKTFHGVMDGETQDMITSIRIICLLVRKPVDGKECDHCRNV